MSRIRSPAWERSLAFQDEEDPSNLFLDGWTSPWHARDLNLGCPSRARVGHPIWWCEPCIPEESFLPAEHGNFGCGTRRMVAPADVKALEGTGGAYPVAY